MRYWAVRADEEIQALVAEEAFIGIGWTEVGDLTDLSRDAIAEKVHSVYADRPLSSRRPTVGMLFRFATQIDVGDIVLTPIKASRRVLMGKVVGPYRYEPNAPLRHKRNIRSVTWEREDISRDDLSMKLRNALAAMLTVFNLDAYRDEIEGLLRGEQVGPTEAEDSPDFAPSDAEYAKLEASKARERITDLLYSTFDEYEFERLVAELLNAMGYKARGRFGPGTDGGVDIIATKDALGLDSERVLVQVKHQHATVGSDAVQRFEETLTGQARGLFVSLGGFTANTYPHRHPRVRLVDGEAFIDLLTEHYEQLSSETHSRLPLKRVYLPAGASR